MRPFPYDVEPSPWRPETAREIRIRPARRNAPWLHVVLFAATFLTTSTAGALQMNENPFLDPSRIVAGFPFAVTLMSILLVHELGHYFTSKLHGVRASLPYFLPGPPTFIGTFGAFIRMQSPPRTRQALFDVGASGPWAGLALAIPAVLVGLKLSEVRPSQLFDGEGFLLGESLLFSFLARISLGVLPDDVTILLHPVAFAGWVGLFVTFLNLIPIGQLDGGHVAYALLGPAHRIVARLCLLFLLGLGFFGDWMGWFVWAVLVSVLGVDHPPTLDLHRPLDRRRKWAAWATAGVLVVTFMPTPIAVREAPVRPEGDVTPVRIEKAPSVRLAVAL
ncbi:MAG: metalloprotease [Candidatus Binatia bacterium]|nr:MAG: metalloprotease [Candidatus Binatia bacterium]